MESGTYILRLTEKEFSTLQEWSARAADGARMDSAADLDSVDVLERLSTELKYARPRTLEELVSFGQDRLREDYFSDVRTMAEEILSEALADETDADSAREDVSERLHESVDGSAWIIYTARAIDVLRVSENDGYALEEFGVETVVSDGVINWSALAFGAMFADVSEHLWADFEDWTETRDEFEEDALERGFSLESFELRDVGPRVRSADGSAWVDGPADRYTLSIELPDGESLSWTMCENAASPAGICQSTDGPGAGSIVSIVSPDIPDDIRKQALVLVDWIRDETGRELAQARETLEEARETLADTRTRIRTAEEVETLEERVSDAEAEVSRLEELADGLGMEEK